MKENEKRVSPLCNRFFTARFRQLQSKYTLIGIGIIILMFILLFVIPFGVLFIESEYGIALIIILIFSIFMVIGLFLIQRKCKSEQLD